MKFSFSEYQLMIDLKENQTAVLVLEDPALFSDFVETCYLQCSGASGGIILSERDSILPLSKTALIISDYFSLDINNRQIHSRLFQQMKEAGNEWMLGKEEFTGYGINLLENILSDMGFDQAAYDLELDWNDIFKLFRVRVEEDYNTLLEKLISYLRVCAELLRIRLLLFVNLKSYLSGEELEELYHMAGYLKIQLLLVESHEREKLPAEKCYIIDSDQCLIVK